MERIGVLGEVGVFRFKVVRLLSAHRNLFIETFSEPAELARIAVRQGSMRIIFAVRKFKREHIQLLENLSRLLPETIIVTVSEHIPNHLRTQFAERNLPWIQLIDSQIEMRDLIPLLMQPAAPRSGSVRRSPRFLTKKPVLVMDEKGQWERAVLLNVSRHGAKVQLLSARRLQARRILVHNKTANQTDQWLESEVMWQEGDSGVIGVQFTRKRRRLLLVEPLPLG